MTLAPSPFAAAPTLVRSAADGTQLAVFEVPAPEQPAGRETAPAADPAPSAPGSRPPLLLIHGATADHTTWRVVGPRFAASRRVFAMDRRGRGASGDAPAYSIELEFEDVASVARSLAETGDGAVDVVGHSYGGRCGLGASLRTPAIRRLVVYEGAPVPPGMTYRPPGLVEAVRAALNRGDNDAALSTFLGGMVGMSESGLTAYRAEPVWPARVAAAHTILREIEAEATEPASLEALAPVSAPVLLLLGSISRSPFRTGTDALAARLAHAQVRVIEGAAHAAHHTHADTFVRLVEAFLDAPDGMLDTGP
jgi:pimeloyl-ACP methyl ester carboxylesterase